MPILHEANMQYLTFPHLTFLRRKLFIIVSGISKYVLTTKYISVTRKTLQLLLNIRTILSSIEIQPLHKQQLVDYFVKNVNNNRP